MTRLSKMFVLIATLASIAVTPSLADRKPTLEERSRIETTHAWPTAGTTT